MKIRAYQSKYASFPTSTDFPESELLKNRPSTAIAFTGGGSRAYVAAIGQIAGLYKLGLIEGVRYIGGISGGSWATMVFTYANVGASDDVLLGNITMPHELAIDKMQIMDPRSARGFASDMLIGIALKALADKTVSSIPDAWAYGVQKTYLDQAGIPAGIPFTWNSDTLSDIYERNPSLKESNAKFLLPTNPKRPFPIVGTTLVGPTDYAPYTPKTQNFTRIEITPLYVGQMRGQEVTYKEANCLLHCEHQVEVGGAIESFAFTRNEASSRSLVGLPASVTSGILSVPTVSQPMDVQFATAASSFAPGAFFESMHPSKLADALGMEFNYWSPSSPLPQEKKAMFTDGGCYENIPLISFLQRKVERIVLFFNAETALQPSSTWDVAAEQAANPGFYDQKQVTDTLSMYFGIWEKDESRWMNRSYQIEYNQVFDQSEYVKVIQGLQAAQSRGDGIIYTAELTTIENKWWGIPAGVKSQITFSYLGRLSSWEKRLSAAMKEVLVPSDEADAANLSVDVKHGPFREFPHYATIGGSINNERANALADLTGWSIIQNEALFRGIFS